MKKIIGAKYRVVYDEDHGSIRNGDILILEKLGYVSDVGIFQNEKGSTVSVLFSRVEMVDETKLTIRVGNKYKVLNATSHRLVNVGDIVTLEVDKQEYGIFKKEDGSIVNIFYHRLRGVTSDDIEPLTVEERYKALTERLEELGDEIDHHNSIAKQKIVERADVIRLQRHYRAVMDDMKKGAE